MGILDQVFGEVTPLLISMFSSDVHTLRYQPLPTHDLRTDEEAFPTDPVNFPVHITPPAPYQAKYIDGTTILATDTWVKIAASEVGALEITPDNFRLILKDGTEFIVKGADKKRSGDNVVLWTLQLRR